MKDKFLRTLACLMAVVMLLAVGLAGLDLFGTTASAANTKSGTCGENVSWIYDDKGTLTISGSGSMYDYEEGEEQSYRPLQYQIKHIVVKNGVTTIGSYAFAGDFMGPIDITIPDSVVKIKDYAFYGCMNLENVKIGKGVSSIANTAFSMCYSLSRFSVSPNNKYYSNDEAGVLFNKNKTILIKAPCLNLASPYIVCDTVKTIKSDAFGNCDVNSIIIPKSVTSIENYAFFDSRISNIYYGGSNKEWNKFDWCDDDLIFLSSTKIHYNYSLSCNTHKFGVWKTIKQPTYTATGTQTRKCTVCGKVETKTLAKLKATSITKCAITVKSATYTGKAVKPTLTVKNGKTTLKAGTHYTVSYKNNTKIGKATVTVTGVAKNGYTGTKTLTFNILPGVTKSLKATQSTSSIKLTWSKVSGATGYRVYRHDGKKWVKLADTKNTTYTVSRLKAGTNYKYAIKAYTTVGKTVYWSASFAQISTATKPATPAIKVTAGKKQAAVSWKKVTGATGYVVYYSTSKNGEYRKLATVKGTSYTAKKLTTGKTYYFKVAAYKTVGKTNIYGSYSTATGAKIK